MLIRNFNQYNSSKSQITQQSKNKKLVESISKLDIDNIKDTDIINLVCDYGMFYEDRDGYGEWNQYTIKNMNEEAIWQTPKQIADALLELLKYDINTYAEVGICKGGSYILISELLKLKNPNLKSVGIDYKDRLTEDIKKYINFHLGTSEDFNGQPFDLAFIDADHSYEGVSKDYKNMGQYAKIVMFHDINDSKCPGVVKFWNEIKEGKKYKEFTYQTHNQPIHGVGLLFNDIVNEKYPAVRHLSSYDSAISILENGFLMSRNELRNHAHKLDTEFIKRKGINSSDKWWNERKELENKRFKSEDLIYCIPDWFNDSGYETGHGSVMFYFNPSIYEDFKVTLTIEDSLTENRNKIYDKNEIKEIYSNIVGNQSNKYSLEAKQILENLNHKNKESVFDTSKGKVFIEGNKFYNKYAEIQIHANKIPINYIKEIRLTDNYFDVKDSDKMSKEKLISLCRSKNIKIR